MEVFNVFGLIAFVFCMFMYSDVAKIKKQLQKEKNSSEKRELVKIVADKYLGKTVKIAMHEDDVNYSMLGKECLVEDVDEEWILLLISEKKSNRRVLVRVATIASLSVIE